MIAGIPTLVNGQRYRSRLEARWAVFFGLLNWPFEYEPFDANGYIPDFVLMGPEPVLVEVKPVVSLQEAATHAARVESGICGVWDHECLLVGVSPLMEPGTSVGCGWDNVPCVGLLGGGAEGWDGGMWHKCEFPGCNRFSFHEQIQYRSRVCGHYDGDHFLGWPNQTELRLLWNQACAETQWKRGAE